MCILSVYVYLKMYSDALLICRPSVNSGIATLYFMGFYCTDHPFVKHQLPYCYFVLGAGVHHFLTH